MPEAHPQRRTLHETIFYPSHDARHASSEYRRVHHHLIDDLDEPCWVCGVRKSTGGAMETHHSQVEWALAGAVEPAKILADFPQMGTADDPHLRAWLDSEGNMLVLCDVHHRHGLYGIHSVTYPAWVVQRRLRDDWDLARGPRD